MKLFNINTAAALLLSIAFLACEKEVSVSEVEKAPDSYAKIFIDSKPQGAKIYFDGKNTGYITPDTVEWMLPGEYRVTLKKEYFKDTNIVVSLTPDNIPSKLLDYTINSSMLGSLQILSEPPGAAIIINDSSTGLTTPYKFNKFLPGLYTITLKYPGSWDIKQQVVVQSQRDSYLNYRMKDTTVWVNYNQVNTDIHSNDLTCLAIDQNGIKWAGSYGYGLISYDEKNWSYYDVSNSPIPGNYINCVIVDKTNRLWIGTDGGLAIKDGGQWSSFKMSNSPLPSNDIRGIDITEDNKVWIATWNGAALYDNGTWTTFTPAKNNFPHPYCSAVAVHPATNEPWFSLYGGGIVRLVADGTYKVWNKKNTAGAAAGGAPPGSKRSGILNDDVQTIAIQPSGDIWAGIAVKRYDKGGLCVFHISEWKWYSYVEAPSSKIYAITFDTDESLWIGNGGSGLSHYDGTIFKTYNSSNSRLENNNVYSIAIDKNGVKWLATYGGGLVKYKGN